MQKSRIYFAVIALLLTSVISFAHGRELIPADQSWKFIREDIADASSPAFDDHGWADIYLPHTWNADDAAGVKKNYFRGVGWYRRHLSITPEQLKKSVYAWFGAAGTSAEVFVNGKSAGLHKGGFQSFCFDISPMLVAEDNVIAVKATNAVNDEIAPLAGDFNVQGGLYRDVHFIVTDSVCISPLDAGSTGVSVIQDKVTDSSATLTIRTVARNKNPDNENVTVSSILIDDTGHEVATLSTQQPIDGGSDVPVNQKITIPNPHLWNGTLDPYLYHVTVTVTGTNGETDSVTSAVGIRTYSVDPNKGFFLNGHPYSLHGVNRHQDLAGKGWAITTADMDADMALCKELGITVIRLAHYQHDQHFYDLCDQNGIVVWAELCLVNKIDPSEGFATTTKQQLTELIKQNLNHPSICFWSLYNELHLTGKDPTVHEHELKLVEELNTLAHQLDRTRLTTAASNEGINSKMNWIPDIIGINRYNGWYVESLDSWPGMLDKMHTTHPEGKIGISEYGAGGSIHQHGLIATTKPLNDFKRHPEEGESNFHEVSWIAMRTRPWIWGTFIWNFADFGVAGRNEGDTPGINDKGLITFDRKTKKDAFYLYKAAWSQEPVLYIAGRRNTPRTDETASVHVYSNCESIQLKLNGQLVKAAPGEDPQIVVFDSVALQMGENKIEATGMKEGKPITDSCVIVREEKTAKGPTTNR